jgi:hypothetical protein
MLALAGQLMMFVLLVTGAESSQSRHKVGVGSPMLLLISSWP